MRKKLFTFLLALAASMSPLLGETYSGNCGTSLKWSLNTEDSTLVIEGSGRMKYNCNQYSSCVPWGNYKRYIAYVSLPNGLQDIQESAFSSCPIRSITIPSSVSEIYNNAFASCNSLVSVKFNGGLYSIGFHAFAYCYSLIDVQPSATFIGQDAFLLVPNITYYGSIVKENYPFGARCINGYIDGYYVYSDNSKTLLRACSSAVGDSVIIPESLKSISSNAFLGCSNIKFVIWNAKNCTGYNLGNQVESFSFGEEVEIIPSSICKGMNKLTHMEIPNNVRYIGQDAFTNCSSITSIRWNAKKCQDFTVAPFPNAITSFSFGSEVEYIPAFLCNNLSNVDTIVLPCSVTSIGENAFNQSIDLYRDCGLTKTTEIYQTLCEGEKLKWNNTSISSVKPSDSGDYTYEAKTVLYDDSIVTLHLSVIPTSYTTLRDTVLCYEDGLTLDGIKCTLHKSITKKQLWSYTLKSIDGCDSVINISVLWKKPEMQLPDTILCYNDDLVLDGIKCPLTKKANIKQLWSYTLQTADGCDSTISINVTWQKLSNFTITTRHEFDTYNSGSISYKKDDANYTGKYYYTLNGEKGRSLYNLSKGNYRLVFYGEECGDSIVKNITINQYGMKVNGMYYLLNENNHTATLTYRGSSYDSYGGEYSGNITIPKTITFEGKEYQVTGIDYSAFSGCNNINSITMESETPISMYSSGLSNNCIIYVPYGSLSAYKSASGWRNYTIHVINPSHATATTGATSATITLGNTNEAKHITSCGMEGGEEEFAGNVIEYIGLEPNSEYANIPLFIKTKEGDKDNLTVSFTTPALELTTKPSKPVSATTAILLAETNMSDAEVSCGFEYKRNDAPADMEGSKVFCPVASGQMAGRLKNLKDDVYYKYRAFYQSAAGNMYYGDWQYIFTGDVAVEFDPILYTYGATIVRENEATISGYALAGSEDFTEQGFEYWAESRTNNGANAPHHMLAALGEHFFVQASGIALRATLTNLDAGTVYKYRVYGKVGDQYYYGSEQAFTTTGTYTPPTYTITFANWDGATLQSSQVEEGTLPEYTGATPERPEDEQYIYTFNGWSPAIVAATADATYTAQYVSKDKHEGLGEVPSDQVQSTKLLHNGVLYIERNGKTYTVTGAVVK